MNDRSRRVLRGILVLAVLGATLGTALLVALAASVFGPIVEILLVRARAFIHHQPLVLGVPGWLPFLYLTAGPGLGMLAKWIVDEPEPLPKDQP
jgi:hypothetical protein